MAKWENFTKEEIENIVKESFSWREVARKLGYAEDGGGSMEIVKKVISSHEIDISHFTGQGWTKSYINYSIFVKGQRGRSSTLLRNLVLIRDHKCEICDLSKWNNKKITLEVHHIDGDNYNNLLENLQLLCPNCHSQTDNWRRGHKQKHNTKEEDFVEALESSQNIYQALLKLELAPKGANYVTARKTMEKHNIVFPVIEKEISKKTGRAKKFCEDCGVEIRSGKTCQPCFKIRSRKVERPSRETLKEEIRIIPFVHLGKKYRVSDNAIKKWCRYYNLPHKKNLIKEYTDEEWEKI